MRRGRASQSALGLALLLTGCPSDGAAKSEAAAVSRAVTSLRDADNEKKSERLETLRATTCQESDICAVRSRCLAAYELHVDVLKRVGSVMWRADAEAGDQKKLDAMKQDLERSRELGAACTDAQGEMIRRYKL